MNFRIDYLRPKKNPVRKITATPVPTALVEAIEEQVAEITRIHGAPKDVKLLDLGMDSLDGADLIMKLEDRFDISIPDNEKSLDEWYQCTITDIAVFLKDRVTL